MSRTIALLEGALIMFVFCLVGFAVSFVSGYVLDQTYNELADAGMLDIPARWSVMEEIDFLISLHYAGLYILPVLGVVIFILNTIRVQRYDRYNEYEYYGGQY